MSYGWKSDCACRPWLRAEWHAQIYRLNEDQLIGLRFAADDEVVELAKQTLEGNLNRKQIKERIKSWRADNWRV